MAITIKYNDDWDSKIEGLKITYRDATKAQLNARYTIAKERRGLAKAELAKIGKVSLGNVNKYIACLTELKHEKNVMQVISRELAYRYMSENGLLKPKKKTKAKAKAKTKPKAKKETKTKTKTKKSK